MGKMCLSTCLAQIRSLGILSLWLLPEGAVKLLREEKFPTAVAPDVPTAPFTILD